MSKKLVFSLATFLIASLSLQAAVCDCKGEGKTTPIEERHQEGCPLSTYMFFIGEDKVSYFDVLSVNDTTFVEVRALSEALGIEVGWDAKQKAILLTKEENTMTLFNDKKEAIVNGKLIELSMKPQIINNRALFPVRFIAEHFGYNVAFDQTNKYPFITITPVPKQVDKVKETDKTKTLDKVSDSGKVKDEVKNEVKSGIKDVK